MISEGAYTAALDGGEQAMREWMIGKNHAELPDSPWKLPKDCPLWHLGLSMAQASAILSRAKAGHYSNA